MLSELTSQDERLKIRSEKLNERIAAEELYKSNMDLQVTSGISVAQDLDTKLPEVILTAEKTNTQDNACQEILKTMKAELDSLQKEQNKIKALMKNQPDAWKKEIKTLKTQLLSRSPICDYVKNDPKAVELCGYKQSKP